VVILEGLCRVSVHGITPAAAGGEDFDRVSLQQLELRPGAPAPKPDPQAVDLGKQLRASTHQLLKLLSEQTGLPAVRRLLELLEAVPAWRAADVVSAALGTNTQVSGEAAPGQRPAAQRSRARRVRPVRRPQALSLFRTPPVVAADVLAALPPPPPPAPLQERLAILLALDHKTRLRLALRLVHQALETVQAATGGGSGGLGPAATVVLPALPPGAAGPRGGARPGAVAPPGTLRRRRGHVLVSLTVAFGVCMCSSVAAPPPPPPLAGPRTNCATNLAAVLRHGR
jgi:hypothetical protein